MDAASLAGDRHALEALQDLLHLGVEPESFLQRYTSIALRPDAVVRRKLGRALELIRSQGFKPVAVAPVRFSHLIVRQHWHADRPLETGGAPWRRIVDLFIESSDSMFVLFEDERPGELSASRRMLEYKGPTAPSQRLPHHLRFILDNSGIAPFNCVHSPNQELQFLRELGLFFNSWRRLGMIQQAIAPSGDVERELDALIAKLYAERAPHDFSVPASLERLIAATQASRARGEIDDDAARLILELCAGARLGDASSIERLFTQLAITRMSFDIWDLAVVCAPFFKADFLRLDELQQELTCP